MADANDSLQVYEPRDGAAVIVDRMPGAAGTAVGLWFPVGSAYEREDERGLSHFVEHMVFKGAGERGAEELSRAVDRVGGYLNAFTERDAVCLHCLIPAEWTELAVSILLDMAYRPRFDRAEFEREKDVIANEIMAAEDDLEEAGQDRFFELSYAGHPYGRRIAGSVDDVRSARFEDLEAFHRRSFARGAVVMTVAGPVDPSRIAALFAEGSAGWNCERGGTLDPGPAPFSPARRAARATGSQVYFFTGLPVEPPWSMDDFWRLTVASSAYGESMSSRLFVRLREREGLCYSVSSAFSLSRANGLWGVSSATSPRQFPRFAEAYLREARALYEAGLEDVEASEAATRMRGLLSLASVDPEYRMKRLARQYLFGGTVETMAASFARFAPGGPLSPDAVNAEIRRRLDPGRENVLLYGKITAATARAASLSFGAATDGDAHA